MNGHIPLPGKNDNFIISVTFEHKNRGPRVDKFVQACFPSCGNVCSGECCWPMVPPDC